MTTKANGGIHPGMWVERNTAFVKIVFQGKITELTGEDLAPFLSFDTKVDSSFGVPNSLLVKVIEILETKATILGVSSLYSPDFSYSSVDVLLGYAEGWFAELDTTYAPLFFIPPFPEPPTPGALIAHGFVDALQAKGVVTVMDPAPGADTAPVGTVVDIAAGEWFVYYDVWDGNMTVSSDVNGGIVYGPGATPGSIPPSSPTGTPGWYPPTAPHAS